MIWVDTGAWLALADKGDAYHVRSREFFRTNREPLITTYPVLVECIHLRLFMRSGVLRQENRKQGVQGCLAASSDVVQALKEGQVEGEFFLGNPPVWAQPGAQQ